MADKVLRDAAGKEIGRYVTSGHEILLKDATGREIGRYDTKADITKDRTGKLVGRGNLLTHLFGLG